MKPRLQVIAGPLSGEIFELAHAEFSIGRATSNNLCLGDAKVSRKHCILFREGAGFGIRDLESQNGTHVNAVPVTERRLEDGDQIKVGETQFVFLIKSELPRVLATTVDLYESELNARSTVTLNSADALYLQQERPGKETLPEAVQARDLDILFKIGMAIHSIRRLDALSRNLLELIFEAVPAERGAILFVEENSDQFAPVFGFERMADPGRRVQVSRTIARRVLKEGASILGNSISDDSSFQTVDSLADSRIESVLCVPMTVFDNAIGILYLDTRNRNAVFDEHHLQLVTAIAAITAIAVINVRHTEKLEEEKRRLQADIDLQYDMVGDSAAMREVYRFITKAAPTDSNVLITGESGTGKELAARAIHRNSPRGDRPFVAINCAALPETLLESELFGHEKGAFTGAVSQVRGKLEVADGGTVFLDEMGEMTTAIQAKLLRALQEKEFERVGGNRPVRVDIRLIAATNRDIDEAVRSGIIREDLYYRLNVVSLRMPALRERREDIPMLARHFTRKWSERLNRKISGISSKAEECLTAYGWPGNVRELENAIERAVVLGDTGTLLPEDFPEPVLDSRPPREASETRFHDAVRDSKKRIILKALQDSGGDYSKAAELLGLHVNNLHRLIRNLDLRQQAKKKRET